MQSTSEEILNLVRIFFVFFAFIAFGIWFLVDSYRMIRFEGKIKRGIKIWSRESSYDAWQYLSSLKQDVVKEHKSLFSSYKSEFIRIQDNEILILSRPQRFHSTWLCVGYVDLKSLLRELEYRVSLPGIIFLLPFTIIGVLIFLMSFVFYERAIDSFIESKSSEFGPGHSTFQPSNVETL